MASSSIKLGIVGLIILFGWIIGDLWLFGSYEVILGQGDTRTFINANDTGFVSSLLGIFIFTFVLAIIGIFISIILNLIKNFTNHGSAYFIRILTSFGIEEMTFFFGSSGFGGVITSESAISKKWPFVFGHRGSAVPPNH